VESRRRFEASLAFAQELNRPNLVAKNQSSLGIVLTVGGNPEAGLSLMAKAQDVFETAGDRFQMAWNLGQMGQAHRLLGNLAEGRAKYREALRMHLEARNLPGLGASLGSMSALQSDAGRHAEAMRLMGAADTVALTTGASAPRLFLRLVELEPLARRAIGDEAVDEALAEGRAMTIDEAVEYAENLTD
jgi:non-specific serine/threonine protein kinase